MTRWTTEHVIGACAKLADALLPKPESAAARYAQ
jgi:hypothetical protein